MYGVPTRPIKGANFHLHIMEKLLHRVRFFFSSLEGGCSHEYVYFLWVSNFSSNSKCVVAFAWAICAKCLVLSSYHESWVVLTQSTHLLLLDEWRWYANQLGFVGRCTGKLNFSLKKKRQIFLLMLSFIVTLEIIWKKFFFKCIYFFSDLIFQTLIGTLLQIQSLFYLLTF